MSLLPQTTIDRRICVAPMMEYTDSHALRLFINGLRVLKLPCSSFVAAQFRLIPVTVAYLQAMMIGLDEQSSWVGVGFGYRAAQIPSQG